MSHISLDEYNVVSKQIDNTMFQNGYKIVSKQKDTNIH